ncbi:unnamed protein product [Toxocara canis]|uniref:Bestrophin homolog n=1 Tax=Toxocara canis TaxID=6265 RepID=A0A183V2J0_TOXCA|nr:unnamed protein product [Toxocara canis]
MSITGYKVLKKPSHSIGVGYGTPSLAWYNEHGAFMQDKRDLIAVMSTSSLVPLSHMTISYKGNFCRLLVRWKGSIWRLVWKELFVFLFLYYTIRFVYNKLLPMLDHSGTAHYRRKFEQLALMFDDYTKLIPLTFLLGFYVSNVVSRWWRQFESLPWPEDLLSVLCMVIPGKDEKSRRRRHAIARYVNLTAAIAWREISSKLRRRFPTMHDIVESGLITDNEVLLLNDTAENVKNVRWMTPLHWVELIVADEVKDNAPMASLVGQFMHELKKYREAFRKLFCYDWVCVPLVYTQVAALATYAYFGFCLLGRQFLDPEKKYKNYEIDLVVPIFTIVQFLFFVGWFKVGQELMRPFGMDDDDIELDYIFQRNVAVSFAVVNKLQMTDYVPLDDDVFWRDGVEQDIQAIPPTGLSSNTKQRRPMRHVPSYRSVIDNLEDGRTRCSAFSNRWKGYGLVVTDWVRTNVSKKRDGSSCSSKEKWFKKDQRETVQEIVDSSGAATIDEKRAGQSSHDFQCNIYWPPGEKNFPTAVNTLPSLRT